MTRPGSLLLLSIALIQLVVSCRQSSTEKRPSPDTKLIAKGQYLFTQNCSTCHNFRQDGIGPQLGGVTEELSAEDIKAFIKDPKAVMESGSDRAKALLTKFGTMMPSFPNYSQDDLDAIIAFLQTQSAPAALNANVADTASLENPIPEPIATSGLVVDLEPFVQFPSSSNELPKTRITKLNHHPLTKDLLMLDLRGKLYRIENQKPSVYMDMARLKSNFIHQPGLATGFGSFAFHPGFEGNGLLYTTHTESPGSARADFSFNDTIKATLQWVLTEWKMDNPRSFPFAGKSRELIRIDMVTGIHGVQEIIFNPNAKPGDEEYGLLYIGVGDGGSVEAGYPLLVHSTSSVWGTILRIDPSGKNSRNGQYGIPKSNPFVNEKNKGILTEIFAFGFRNPHRITWTRSGMMLAANIGQKHIESLYAIVPGADYGWPIREGTFEMHPEGDLAKVYPLPPDDSLFHITYPVAQFDHDEGKAINGGYEYTGTRFPELQGKFLFGDVPSARLFYVEVEDLVQGRQAIIKEWNVTLHGRQISWPALCGTDRIDMRLGRDANGEMYLFTKPDGKLYRFARISKKEL